MPCLGLSPFLPSTTVSARRISICVNALSRAIPISTVTSRNPHKQGAQFRNNTCNCQTIQFCPYFYSIFSFTWYSCSFSPEMVRLSTFLLYMFFYTGSRYFCFFGMLFYICISAIDISIPITPQRHPFGCLYVISSPCFSCNFISFVSIIPPTVSSYFLHHENSFLRLSPLRHFLFL